MTFCGEASTWSKVALILTVLSFGLHCAGFGTNYWMARYTVKDIQNLGIGLWRMTNCSGYYKAPCVDGAFPESYVTNKVHVTRAMETMALLVLFVINVCLLFYVATRKSRTRGMAIAILTMGFVAGVLSLTGTSVWIANMPAYHAASWSMGLTVFSITLVVTAAILMIPDIREYDYKDVLRIGGEFSNLKVSRAEEPHPPPPAQVEMYKEDLGPPVVPQNPMAAPTYQFLHYNKHRKMDGF